MEIQALASGWVFLFSEDIIPESVISEHVQEQLSTAVNKSSKDVEILFKNTDKIKEKVIEKSKNL